MIHKLTPAAVVSAVAVAGLLASATITAAVGYLALASRWAGRESTSGLDPEMIAAANRIQARLTAKQAMRDVR